MRHSQSGFSLLELMVAVSIMGVISAMSVPNVMQFTRRAKQKEGIALMSSLYGTMRTSRAQLELFPGDFVGAGYRPEGNIDYHIYLQDPAGAGYQPAYPSNWYCDRNCVATEVATCEINSGTTCNDGQVSPNYQTWFPSANAVLFASLSGPEAALCTPTAATTTFLACAYGDLGGVTNSIISVNEQKQLIIQQDGTN